MSILDRRSKPQMPTQTRILRSLIHRLSGIFESIERGAASMGDPAAKPLGRLGGGAGKARAAPPAIARTRPTYGHSANGSCRASIGEARRHRIIDAVHGGYSRHCHRRSTVLQIDPWERRLPRKRSGAHVDRLRSRWRRLPNGHVGSPPTNCYRATSDDLLLAAARRRPSRPAAEGDPAIRGGRQDGAL